MHYSHQKLLGISSELLEKLLDIGRTNMKYSPEHTGLLADKSDRPNFN